MGEAERATSLGLIVPEISAASHEMCDSAFRTPVCAYRQRQVGAPTSLNCARATRPPHPRDENHTTIRNHISSVTGTDQEPHQIHHEEGDQKPHQHHHQEGDQVKTHEMVVCEDCLPPATRGGRRP